MEAGEVPRVLAVNPVNELLGRDAFLVRAQHDGRAMGVVGTDVMHLVPLHLLEAHPDIRLNVLHEMAEMDAAVGVRQRRGDENPALHFETDGKAGILANGPRKSPLLAHDSE